MRSQKTKRLVRWLAILIAAALIFTSFSFVAFLPGLIGANEAIVYAAETEEASKAYLEDEFPVMEKLLNTIHNKYKDKITYEELMDGAYKGIFEALEDPYSVYFADTEQGKNFVDSVNGTFSGIGISVKDIDGTCSVLGLFPDSPAEKAGMKVEDIVTAVDGINVSGKTIHEVVALIKGEKGTEVSVCVDRKGTTLTFKMKRDVISSLCIAEKLLDDQMGYIRITSFDNDAHIEFEAALNRLIKAGAKSLILDVRDNPGGLIGPAAEIVDQLMGKGTIFHFEQQGEIVESIPASDVESVDLPMVLLVNDGSASASEILAGALQDNKKAILVGTKTFGKGVAQQVGELKNGSNIKLSTYYFLTPNKTTINHVGITPDYVVYNGGEQNLEELKAKLDAFVPMIEKVKATAGQVGLNVYGAQQRLQVLRFDVALNGTMDHKTVAAIKGFQKQYGLYAYGGLDYATIKALNEAVLNYAVGNANGSDDLQLTKAIELLNLL